MTAYLLADHLLNFLAPAACLSLILMLLAQAFKRFLMPKSPWTQSICAQAAMIFVANTTVLVAGLVIFGNDGKMATYAAMVVCGALCQWALWCGWTK